MSYLEERIKAIKAAWKQIAILGTWIVAVAGSLLLPLPAWNSEEEHISQTRFIVFIATVIAGFVLIATYKYKNKKGWLLISLISFVLFSASYNVYNIKREANTLPYYETTVVIGSVHQADFEKKRKAIDVEADDIELLKYVGGDAVQLWTKESIDSMRWKLIMYLTLAYVLFAVFIISFVHTILIILPTHDHSKAQG